MKYIHELKKIITNCISLSLSFLSHPHVQWLVKTSGADSLIKNIKLDSWMILGGTISFCIHIQNDATESSKTS